MFRSKDDGKDSAAAGPDAAAEFQRLDALALPDLAAEVMVRGFGPGSPGGRATTGIPGITTVEDILAAIAPGANRLDMTAYRQIYDVIGEGVQVLEHAGLLRGTVLNNVGGRYVTTTRLGRAALDRDEVRSVLAAGKR
jgi:hypothetical protein